MAKRKSKISPQEAYRIGDLLHSAAIHLLRKVRRAGPQRGHRAGAAFRAFGSGIWRATFLERVGGG